uniref:Reverse transcriptase domain-containing protein n=1 Tax=Leptobrachium leishanense TaxID=445787 RepID=A0A8C5WDK8_9ANUR
MISKEMTTFENMVLREIDNLQAPVRDNLSKEDRKALKELADHPDIVVRPADKGGGIVLLSRSQYETEANRILNDTCTYRKLMNNPMKEINEKIDNYANKGEELGILSKNESDFLRIKFPKVPIFYYLPKIHKHPVDPPGRPIISSINSPSSNLSQYIDHLLQPFVKSTPSYLKDTGDILKIVDSILWEQNDFLVTCDVRSLYTIIPHEMGCKAVFNQLRNTGLIDNEQIDFIVEGINLILTNNFFYYKDQCFLQSTGTAMGSKFAPSYANLFMTEWEDNFIRIDTIWTPFCTHFRRYIDDIFFVWKGGESALLEFLKFLNTNDWGIFLESTYSNNPLIF